MRNVLIVGATSAIAQAVARRFAADGDRLFLVGRNVEKLQAVAADLRVRGASQVESYVLDLRDLDRHPELIDLAEGALGPLDMVLIAHGVLPDQKACEASVEATLDAFQVNALSVISLLTLLANRFEARRRGTLAVLSSVAGDRGRRNNYVYGAAKGAVSLFTEGLRARLFPAGVRVVTVKPGPVDTPMTAHLKKSPLFADPDDVGARIYRAMVRGEDVVYVPWFWRWIMFVLRLVPEAVFKRLNLRAG